MRNRPGYALIISILLVGVLAVGAGGILALGAREQEIAAAMARRTHARLTAESEVRAALARWSTRALRAMEIGHPWTPGGDGPGPVTITRLAETLYLVEAAAQVPGPATPVTARAGALVRTLDPCSLAAAFPAALAATHEARLLGGTVAASPASTGVLAPRVRIAPAAVVTGEPPAREAAPPDLPAPHLFSPPVAADLATVTVAGPTVTPRPRATADGCESHPSNWGAVSATNPCHDLRPFILAGGPLAVRGGEGRGLLVVRGDLDLAGLRFHGLILATGHVTIGPGTELNGAVRARTIEMRDGTVHHDAAPIRTALTAGGLDGPFRPPHRLWIPLFD